MNLVSNFKWILLAALLVGGFVVAQDYQRQFGGNRNRGQYDERNGVPNWDSKQDFKHDVFTFARIQYDSVESRDRGGRYGWRGGRGGVRDKWQTDYPDADLNLSFRLKELTSLEVDPDGVIIRLTDPELFDYPFIYMVEPGHLKFREEEVVALRRYLDKGGFMMVDDFWAEEEWANFEREMRRVFPARNWKDIGLDHKIFHIVYDIEKLPQIPSIYAYMRGMQADRPDATVPHYRGFFDDNDRMMVFICHNTDLGDGWEREGVDRGYFEEYSEPYAYPLGINIVTYALTH